MNSRRVKYLVIGGYAAIAYGIGRLTKDVDLFVPTDVRNAERLLTALKDIEFGTAHLITAEGLFAKPITIFNDYFRVDVLTVALGLEFEAAWAQRTIKRIDGVRVSMVNIDDLIQSKRAAGRPVDLEDVRVLEMIRDKHLKRPTTQE